MVVSYSCGLSSSPIPFIGQSSTYNVSSLIMSAFKALEMNMYPNIFINHSYYIYVMRAVSLICANFLLVKLPPVISLTDTFKWRHLIN